MEDKMIAAARVVHTRVFAAQPYGGNPCPVIVNADHLSDEQMQTMATTLGLDTAFVLQPRAADAELRIRYFVPDHELGVSGRYNSPPCTTRR